MGNDQWSLVIIEMKRKGIKQDYPLYDTKIKRKLPAIVCDMISRGKWDVDIGWIKDEEYLFRKPQYYSSVSK